MTEHSDISAERYNQLAMNTNELVMDIGTILDGQDAVDEGLIDSIGNLNDAVSALYRMIRKSEKKKTKKS